MLNEAIKAAQYLSGLADENKKRGLWEEAQYQRVEKERVVCLVGWWFCGRYQADTAVKPKESNQKEEHTDTALFRLADLSLRQELFLAS